MIDCLNLQFVYFLIFTLCHCFLVEHFQHFYCICFHFLFIELLYYKSYSIDF